MSICVVAHIVMYREFANEKQNNKRLDYLLIFSMLFFEMKIIKVKPSVIAKVRNLGAKIANCYITPLQHKSYEGKKRNQEDYLYAVKAYCDNCILIAFTSKQ